MTSMKRNLGITARQSIYSAINTSTVQVIAILSLTPSDYGAFSLYYLAFAIASSVTYSAVAEAWIRSGRDGRELLPWVQYCTTLLAVAGLALILVAVAGVLAGAPALGISFGLAICLTTYRLGARYYSVAVSHFRYVGPADLIGAIVMVIGFWALQEVTAALTALSLAWVGSSLVSVLLSERPRIDLHFGPRHWVRAHRASIGILFLDSALSDIGTIGVPLLLAPLLGPAKFGVYRAVSSAALPVRLMLDPIRPILGGLSVGVFARARTVLVALLGATAIGAAAFLTLAALESAPLLASSVLNALSEYALPVGIFVGGNFLGMLYYLVGRAHFSAKRLLLYRIVETVGAVIFPVVGYVWSDLTGAIWGYVLVSIVNATFAVGLVGSEDRATKNYT